MMPDIKFEMKGIDTGKRDKEGRPEYLIASEIEGPNGELMEMMTVVFGRMKKENPDMWHAILAATAFTAENHRL